MRAGVNNPRRSRIRCLGPFSRDLTAASGNVGYTGLDYVPRGVIAIGVINNDDIISIGMAGDDLVAGNIQDLAVMTVWTYNPKLIGFEPVAGNSQLAVVASYEYGGCTLTWTKAALPTGIGTFFLLFFE